MKLITLNIWGGYVHQPLLRFIESHQEIDIFCLQEVYHKAPNKISSDDKELRLDIFAELQALLPNHRGLFKPTVDNIYGIAVFVNKEIAVISEGEIIIHENPDYIGRGPTHSRNLQWLKCHANNQDYLICNVHGLWNGLGKTDTPARLSQSEKIKNFIDSVHLPTIVCGDFNLRPDTESLKIITHDMNNLIEAYQVTSTRTSFYPKEEKFADYIFTSPDIIVNHFQVLPDEVSDHSPLLLEFN